MYKQRLSKVIFCITLAISVFLYRPSISLAREVTDEDFTGSVEFYGGTWMYLDEVSLGNIAPDSTVKSVYGSLNGSDVISVHIKGLEVGRTYSGYISLNLTYTPNYVADTSGVTWHRYNASFSPVTQIDGISIGTGHLSMSAEESLSFKIYIYFNNWYNDIGTGIFYTFDILLTHGFFSNDGSVPAYEFMNLTKSVDWAGTLYQRLPSNGSQLEVDAIQDQSAQLGQISQQEMQQQQQIANQQSQQSAQQHEDLKEGFIDNTYNNNVSSAGSQVDSYIDLEHNLLEQQNQQMSDYADTAFNLNTLSPYINAIALTSTFFTWIWNGFGELSVVFVIVLAIGVACLILGIRRRG